MRRTTRYIVSTHNRDGSRSYPIFAPAPDYSIIAWTSYRKDAQRLTRAESAIAVRSLERRLAEYNSKERICVVPTSGGHSAIVRTTPRDIVAAAIAESIRQGLIVSLRAADVAEFDRLADELSARADDYVSAEHVHDDGDLIRQYLGTSSGNEWRVHIQLPKGTGRPAPWGAAADNTAITGQPSHLY